MENKQALEKLASEYLIEGLEAYERNELNQAVLLMRNVVQLYRKAGNEEAMANALNYEGVFYSAIGNESLSLDCYLQGLDIAIEKQYSYIAVRIYNNIGVRYQELGSHEKAIEYFHKAEAELEHPQCKRNENYPAWALVTFLDLCISHTENGELSLAEWYLNKTKGFFTQENREAYGITVLIAECRLNWRMGNKEYVRERISDMTDTLRESYLKSDYLQNVKQACDLFKRMEEYDSWKRLIEGVNDYAEKQGSLYYRTMAIEMWMDYYKTIGDVNKYNTLCVQYVELDNERKIENLSERSEAIDVKIELQAKEQQRKRAEKKSNTDKLTGLSNRYKMEADCGNLIEDCRSYNQSIVVGIIDIDCFKEVNDSYGHIRGDECLTRVADILKTTLDDAGTVYRYGGDEFVILMSGCTAEIVNQFAEMIQNAIDECGIENANSCVKPRLTLSQGYAIFNHLRRNDNFETLLKEADDALYYVKENGRNSYKISNNERQ